MRKILFLIVISVAACQPEHSEAFKQAEINYNLAKAKRMALEDSLIILEDQKTARFVKAINSLRALKH